MRFVAAKSAEAQGAGVIFRTRDLLVRQRTQLINALRGHLAEFGHVAAKGPAHVARLVELVRDHSSGLPEEARSVLLVAVESLEALKAQITVLDRQIEARAKASPLARRLMTIPGVGPVLATALVALAPAPSTLPARTGPRRLGGAYTAPALIRRQGAAGSDHQDGRALSAPAPDPGRQLRGQGRRSKRRARPLAGAHAGQEAQDAGHGRAGQQDSQDRLGADGARRILQSSDRGGRVATAKVRDVEEAGRSNREVWRNGQRDGAGKTSENVRAPRARHSGMDPARELHTGQRPGERPHQQAGHTAAPDPLAQPLEKPLASVGAFSNRASSVKPAVAASGSWFSSRSALAAAASGPVRRAGAARSTTGLRRMARPRPLAAQSPTPSPEGDCVVRRSRTLLAAQAWTSAHRNGSPDLQMLWRMTASLRAKATRALPGPAR